jgi:hypothetical protein
MPVQFMNKTIWFVHVDVNTSLQLLEIVCWCRGFASGGWFDLPCSSLWLVLDLLHGLLLNREQFFARAAPGWGFWLCVLPVLSVLAIWWLTRLPVDEWARVWLKKGYICLSLALSGRQQWWFHLVTPHSAGVLFSMHTCTVSCLCVCVCLMLCTWMWEDQLGRAEPYPLLSIILLTCQVAMPLGIILVLLCCVQGIKSIIKWRWRSSDSSILWN